MTDNISVHMRITGLNPTNDEVDSRRAAATALASSWGKIKTPDQIVSKAAAIASSLGGNGAPSAELGSEVQTAVQKKASAFLYAERPLDVGICAGMAAVAILRTEVGTGGWQVSDVYSNALWLALEFQPVLQEEKREDLRREVLELAQSRSVRSAERARERLQVPDSVDLVVKVDDGGVTTNFKKAALATIEALVRNAALDREELDFMWWSQLARSRLLDRPLSSLSEPLRLVASGVEAARHLRRLPADVHRDLVLRTAEEDSMLDLSTLLTEIGSDYREKLAAGIQAHVVEAHPSVFPLLSAISTGDIVHAGADIKRRATTWGARALLEGALARMISTGALRQ